MKPITKKLFRILLVFSVVATVAGAVAGFLDSRLLPQPLLDYLESQHGVRPGVGELVISLLGIPGVIAGIVSVIGLYRFWPCARLLSVATWVYMLVWMIFSPGPVLTNAVSSAFTQCSTLLAGAVLAIVYFSPAADWFQKKEPSRVD
jgi:hypothetical protein